MNTAPRLTSVVFRLTRQKLQALKELSRSTRVRQSEYLREAIDDVLNKYEREALATPVWARPTVAEPGVEAAAG